MRYFALATDYDGTLAHDGAVSPDTIRALESLRQSGRSLILVTGRELPDLERNFSRLDLFDRVVGENGAILYNPETKTSRVLAAPPPAQFVDRLRTKGVPNISTGAVIVAMWRPHEQEAIDAIRDLGLELQIIFNKDAVMILPAGVNKQTGLVAALEELKISPHGAVAVGDAENDHAFLGCCECAVAVANAIPSLKEEADLVTQRSHGDGVSELIEKMIENDLADLAPKLARHDVALGKSEKGDIALRSFGTAALVCGQSGSGKSTLIAGLVERLTGGNYQVCLIDPEGDYERADEFIATGDATHAPSLDHLESMLSGPESQIAVNLVGVPMRDRAGLFGRVLALVRQHRAGTGRPHWLIVDEAHHMFPVEWNALEQGIGSDPGSFALITVHPGHVSPAVLKGINALIVVGRDPAGMIGEFCDSVGRARPAMADGDLESGEAWVWFVDSGEPIRVRTEPAHMAHERHKRKYAQGRLEEERVFYFRGPEDRLKLRAQNLQTFVQLAEGVDDATWTFHLKRGDYSRWLREGIKDPVAADEIEGAEKDESLTPAESRKRVTRAIESRYTAPA